MITYCDILNVALATRLLQLMLVAHLIGKTTVETIRNLQQCELVNTAESQ